MFTLCSILFLNIHSLFQSLFKNTFKINTRDLCNRLWWWYSVTLRLWWIELKTTLFSFPRHYCIPSCGKMIITISKTNKHWLRYGTILTKPRNGQLLSVRPSFNIYKYRKFVTVFVAKKTQLTIFLSKDIERNTCKFRRKSKVPIFPSWFDFPKV